MYQYIAIALIAAAIALFFFLDKIIDIKTENTTLGYIYDNNKVIAGACVVGAYLAYTESLKAKEKFYLPSYGESISTSEALRM
jgi:hypothetical protein